MSAEMSHAAPPSSGASEGPNPRPSASERRLPPVAELAVASVTLMVSGGVYLAAHLPTLPPLAPAVGLLVGGAVLTLIAMVLLARIRPFAWRTFFLVARWAFSAYVVIAGLLALVFIYDHTRGTTLAVLMLTLVVFALDVPVIVAFTVARYAEPVSDDAPRPTESMGSDTPGAL